MCEMNDNLINDYRSMYTIKVTLIQTLQETDVEYYGLVNRC